MGCKSSNNNKKNSNMTNSLKISTPVPKKNNRSEDSAFRRSKRGKIINSSEIL